MSEDGIQQRSHLNTPSRLPRPGRLISGGQTGVDRTALDVAIALNLQHGGWCPRHRLAEDGRIPDRYYLTETDASDYETRTRRNVDEADATLVFAPPGLSSPGTQLTISHARVTGKPVCILRGDEEIAEAVHRIRRFLQRHAVRTLNVAGPRQSEAPGLVPFVRAVLQEAFQ